MTSTKKNHDAIVIGADHAGFELKEFLKKYLSAKHIRVVDEGNHVFDKNDDYPDYAFRVGERVANTANEEFLCAAARKACASRQIKCREFARLQSLQFVMQKSLENILTQMCCACRAGISLKRKSNESS